jgi:hypothetical protein
MGAPPTPQTPSTLYGTTVVVGNQYIELVGNKYLVVKGALSMAYIDMPFYDNTTYRDQVDVSVLGRPPMDVMILQNTAGPTFLGSPYSNNGDSIWSSQSGDPISGSNVVDEVATMIQQDDRFTHTAPHQTLGNRTQIRWFDNAIPGSGNCLAWQWLDQVVGTSNNAIPQSNGSAPPAYTP